MAQFFFVGLTTGNNESRSEIRANVTIHLTNNIRRHRANLQLIINLSTIRLNKKFQSPSLNNRPLMAGPPVQKTTKMQDPPPTLDDITKTLITLQLTIKQIRFNKFELIIIFRNKLYNIK